MERGMKDSVLDRGFFDIWSAVSHGTDFFNRGMSVVDRWQTWDSYVDYKNISNHYKNIFESRKVQWKLMADSSLNVYEYLKSKIYKDYL
jgi:hypothetical protein